MLREYFVLKRYLFLHILVLYSHFFLVLIPFFHSKTKQYQADKKQSCHNNWPRHSIFGAIIHNTWKGHKERETLMPNFGNWKPGSIELFLLHDTCSPHGPCGTSLNTIILWDHVYALFLFLVRHLYNYLFTWMSFLLECSTTGIFFHFAKACHLAQIEMLFVRQNNNNKKR